LPPACATCVPRRRFGVATEQPCPLPAVVSALLPLIFSFGLYVESFLTVIKWTRHLKNTILTAL